MNLWAQFIAPLLQNRMALPDLVERVDAIAGGDTMGRSLPAYAKS